MSWPSIDTLPDAGEMMPARQRSVVVFPAPLGPTRPRTSPGATSNEMQVLQVEGFEKRVVYNVAKAYVNQIARGALYPDLMNIYADRGNLLVLERRCRWRGISFELQASGLGEALDPDGADLYYIGGG